MAINLASKYSTLVDEAFYLEARTEQAVNHDYDWVGVETVKVYSVETSAMNNYTRTGANRYGTPAELGDSVQELTLSRDRSFTYTIDRGNNDEQMYIKEAGSSLARQIREVVVPEIDIYRLSTMGANAGNTVKTVLTNANAYDCFLDGISALTDAKAPDFGRIAYITPKFYKLIKEDELFIKSGDLSQEMLIRGEVGMVDGVRLILVPTSYLPTDSGFLLTNPIAVTAPVKLVDYKIHDNPPGINGHLVEGRVIYDTFVLDNKKDALYLHLNTTP